MPDVQKMHHSSSAHSKEKLVLDQCWLSSSFFCLCRVREATTGHKEKAKEENLDPLDQRSVIQVHTGMCAHTNGTHYVKRNWIIQQHVFLNRPACSQPSF